MSRFFTLIAIGIAIGILIAPEKGAVTRKKLNDFIDDMTDELNQKRSKIAESLQNVADTLE